MSSIPENIRILWPSSATTPSGWTTDTAFNDVMPFSANSGSGTGGANTHTHNGNSHSHPGGSHSSHTYAGSLAATSPYQSCYNNYNGYYTWGTGGSGRGACHLHPSGGGLGSATTGSSGGGSGNYNSQSSLPAYYTFRVIKSDGSGDGFPANSVVLWGTASNPTTESGWTQHSGSMDKYVRGASNGGSAAGGGSHSHASSSNHTHSGGGGSHTHTGSSTSGTTSPRCGGGWGGGETCYGPCSEGVSGNHTHTRAAAGSGTASGTANAAGGGSSGGHTNAATFISVWGVTNSSDSWLEGGIGFISGETLSTFTDEDWVLCDGNNGTPNLNAAKYIKLSASGASSSTGGSSSHNHSNPGGHSHPGGGSHTHNVNTSASGSWNYPGGDGSGQGVAGHPLGSSGGSNPANQNGSHWMRPNDHSHALTSTATNASATGSYGSGTQGVVQATGVNPAYKTVTWIMAPEAPSAGGNVGMFGSNF